MESCSQNSASVSSTGCTSFVSPIHNLNTRRDLRYSIRIGPPARPERIMPPPTSVAQALGPRTTADAASGRAPVNERAAFEAVRTTLLD